MFPSNRLLPAAFLAILFANCALAATVTFKEGIAGATCFVQPVTFSSKSFSYSLYVKQPTTLAAGCAEEQVYVSPIYMAKTCLQTGVTSKSGCPSNIVNGTVIGGTTLSSGERTSTSNTTALCNQVFDYGAYEDVSTYLVDSAYVSCAPDYTGYFYIQNNCPSNTTQSTITIQLDYTTSTCSANYKNNWANNWKIVVGVVCGIILLTFLCICVSTIRKKKRMNQMANGVQMMPPPPPQMGSTPIPSQAYSGTPTYTPYNAVPQPPTTYTPSGPKPSGPTSTSYPPPPPGYPQPSYPADTGNAPAVWYKGADNKAP